MSDYTTQVRFICESCAGLEESGGYKTVNEVVQLARPKIFDFEYPIFDSAYKSVLESKILKHYYTREICEETYGLWKLRLDSRLNEIMPYYNQLYKSEQLTFNPLIDFEISKEYNKNGSQSGTETNNGSESEERSNNSTINETEERNKNNTDNRNATSSFSGDRTVGSNGDTLSKFSDTPQGGLTDLKNGAYLTNATHTESANNETANDNSEYEEQVTTTNNGTVNSEKTHSNNTTEQVEKTSLGTKENQVTTTEEYLERITGKQSGISYSQLLNEYRTTFLNIDKMVIADLNDLFFGLW